MHNIPAWPEKLAGAHDRDLLQQPAAAPSPPWAPAADTSLTGGDEIKSGDFPDDRSPLGGSSAPLFIVKMSLFNS